MRTPVLSAELWTCRLGVVPYREAVALQERVRERRAAGELPDVLLLLEHPPTYTCGRRSGAAELPYGADFYAHRGIEVVATDRGGRVTYHGPGQLVGYPIVGVRDIVAHVRTLESALVEALGDERIEARSRAPEGPDFTGVWVQERKIASIGVHVSRGIATHGFAVNVVNDLEPFSWIVPCGLAGVAMTSIARERERLGDAREPSLSAFGGRVQEHLGEALGVRARAVSAWELGEAPSSRGAEQAAPRVAVHA